MHTHIVWQKTSWLVVLLSVFLMACTQAKNTPTAQHGPAVVVMPTRAPQKVSEEQMTVARTQVLSQKLNTTSLNEFSLEQWGDLLKVIGQANPKSNLTPKVLFAQFKDRNAIKIHPDFTGLNEVQAHNAQLLYDAIDHFLQRWVKLESTMDTKLFTSKDVENIDGDVLYGLIINYISKHPEQRRAMRAMSALPNESKEAFHERQWDAFGAIAGKNLRLLNRYMEYYSEQGWWRFSR